MKLKSTFLLLFSLLTLSLSSASASETTGSICTGVGCVPQGTVIVAPTASPVAGTYTSAQSVTLTATGASSIHYRTDGTSPTCSTGTTYSGAISVGSSQTIMALSCYPNSASSTVASFAYTINISSGGGGGGGGGGGYIAPAGPTNTSIAINAGAATSSVLSVTLTLSATNAAQMIVSNDAGFAGASWEAYATSKVWTLTSGDGLKTVYVKFKDSYGNMTNAISDAITLSQSGTVAPVITTPAPTQGCSGGNQYNTSTGAPCINNSLPQGQGEGVYPFSRDLDLGSKGDDVLALQKFLNSKGFIIASSGPGSPGKETNTFGGATQKALAKFQKANGLLAQGYFGAKTRALIASMGNTSTTQTTPTTPAKTTEVKPVLFTRNLDLGSRGNDVLELQKFLVDVNAGPKAGELAKNGVTTYFGNLTKSVLAEYQKSVGIKPASGYFGPSTRAYVESHR